MLTASKPILLPEPLVLTSVCKHQRSSVKVIVEAHTLAEKRSWQTLGSSQFWIIAVDAGTQRRVNVPPVVPATSADVEMHQSAAEARCLSLLAAVECGCMLRYLPSATEVCASLSSDQ